MPFCEGGCQSHGSLNILLFKRLKQKQSTFLPRLLLRLNIPGNFEAEQLCGEYGHEGHTAFAEKVSEARQRLDYVNIYT